MKQVFLIILLSLLQHSNCNKRNELIQKTLNYVVPILGKCSNYFEYVHNDDYIYAKLTLTNIKIGDTVKLHFYTVNFKHFPNLKGIFLPNESPQSIISKLTSGEAITYRIDLPFSDYLPELEKILINDNELCTGSTNKYKDHFVLEHKMEIVSNTLPVYTRNIYIPHFIEANTCGIVSKDVVNYGVTPLIYGGTVINRGEFPWLTAIYKKQRTGIAFICGGSLVTSRMVLTAAHCFQGLGLTADRILVYLGRHNLSTYNEPNVNIQNVETLIMHPSYNGGLQFADADLAILKLPEAVTFTKFIQPICVWNDAADLSLIVNKTALVAGWGSDEEGYSISDAPKKVKLDIVSESECLRSSPAFTAITSPRTICAGKRDGTGPCEGDSGGGLMINQNGIWMLRGIVSAGLVSEQRCNLREYTVYCDVAKHRDWLENYIGQQEQPIVGALKDVCGVPGNEPHNQNPWLAAIYRKLFNGEMLQCTGVLISARSVVAPAFCFNLATSKLHPDFLKIYFGRYDLNNFDERNVVVRDVANVIQHPNFASKGYHQYDYDVALVQLKSAVSFTESVKPICLWSEAADVPRVIGESVTLLSWHWLKVFDETQTVPRSKEVQVVSFDHCEKDKDVHDTSYLCTPKFEDNIAGVLMLKHNGQWFLRGVGTGNSYYTEEISLKSFRPYSDVGQYLPWIRREMLA